MTWTDKTPLKVGHHPPEQCARGRSDCRSLAQVISSDGHTFVCCGEIAPDGEMGDPRDKWALCIRGDQRRDFCTGTDVRIFIDRTDMQDIAAVVSMGLSVAAERV